MKKKLQNFKKNKILLIILACLGLLVIVIFFVSLRKRESIELKKELCIVQFEANGGTTVAQQEIECGSVIVQPDNPQKEGFVFKYWEYNGEEYNFSNPVETNIVLKPFYEVEENVEIVVISFDTKGGNKTEDIKIKKGETIEKPISPKKTGYKFIGWYIGNKEYNFSNPIDKDITLEAKWEKNIENSKPNTGNNNSTSNENSNTNNNENKEDTKLDVHHEYDDLVNSYLGTWYLSGYNDVYFIIERKVYTDTTLINFYCINFNAELKKVEYITLDNFEIKYNNWNEDLEKNSVIFNTNTIMVNGLKFVRNKGEKNRHDETYFKQSLGTWYMYNRPEKKLVITERSNGYTGIQEVINYTGVCIEYININQLTRCNTVKENQVYNDSQITMDGNILYMKINNEKVKFYKTPIVEKVTNIELNKSSLNLNIGESEGLTASISPSNAVNKEVTWTSSDTSIATVSSNGVVTAKKKGVATITVTTKDGNKTATCVVNVKTVNVTGITLNKTTLNLVRNQTGTLSVTVLPTNATNKNYTWSSSDTTVATVSSNGVVTAKKKGKAIITVTTEDGNKTASCTVDVSNPKLTADTSIGLSYIAGSTGTIRGIKVTITASGGSGSYNYYNIKLYKDGVLIGSSTNTNSNTLFVEGHSNGSYYAEIEVRDSEGNVFNATSSVSTISGF